MVPSTSIPETGSVPAVLAQRQLEAYNARDLDAFMACYCEDVEVYTHPNALTLKGHDAFRARYVERFKSEGLKATILHRVILGDKAIDHERVWYDGDASTPEDLVVVYTVRDDKIARVDFVREGAA